MGHPFSWSEWGSRGAVEIVRHVQRGDVTVREIADQASAAARSLDSELGAFVEVLDAPHVPPDLNLSAPEQGLLAGLPLFLKDLGSSVAGLRREYGSALHRDEVVPSTDPVAAAWLGEGAQVLGRTTTAELGMAYDTSTVYRGLKITRNPWNPTRTAGGSSGGAAALVAAGIAQVAHATDGAGSIRLPAAINGLVGLKVSRGRLPPIWGANELSNGSFVEGVVARSLEDTALLLDAATRSPAPLGSQYVATPHDPTRALAALAEPLPRALRVGVTTSAFGRAKDRSAEQITAVRRVADALAREGHHVEEIAERDLPNWEVVFSSFETFWLGVRVGSWRLSRGGLTESERAGLSPVARRYYEASSRYGKPELLRFLASNAGTTEAFARLLTRHDVLLLPAFPYATPEANGAFSTCVDHPFDEFVKRFLDAGRYTIPASESGLPALVLPAGFDAQGMPLAVQLYGRWRGETDLLRAGRVVRELLDVQRSIPEVHVSRL